MKKKQNEERKISHFFDLTKGKKYDFCESVTKDSSLIALINNYAIEVNGYIINIILYTRKMSRIDFLCICAYEE